ncbi:YiiD C-terminal domain-containing protein [Pelagicoccus mobilis]|uniref:YiiD C-terminal domain-containing protein n=1 Tax=Pelagicoccus mobilis TaxID=415221 RepID=A0A934S2M6_9BACT|nr:YiiD C-terminal domain-containing protein [Pelagicoccus mobilis]MBK1879959.1 YiiD C-terminal domain-containing protein [Pelagicoccus mobilis]
MELPLKRVEEFLHNRIPVSKAIDCQVVEASDKCLKLSASKIGNTVMDSEFSDLSGITLCKLSSWAFLQVSLQRLNYKPFTSLSHATFSKNREIDSNSSTLFATCCLPSDKEWQQFLRMLSRKARAKVSLVATLSDELGETATLTCEYDTRDLDPA